MESNNIIIVKKVGLWGETYTVKAHNGTKWEIIEEFRDYIEAVLFVENGCLGLDEDIVYVKPVNS